MPPSGGGGGDDASVPRRVRTDPVASVATSTVATPIATARIRLPGRHAAMNPAPARAAINDIGP